MPNVSTMNNGYPLRSVAPLSALVPLKEGQCFQIVSTHDEANIKELSPFKGDERNEAGRNGAEGVKLLVLN